MPSAEWTPGKLAPERLAEAYFQCMRDKDLDGLGALYADDPVFVLPTGQEFTGRQAVLAMHEGVFGAGAPVPTPMAMIAGEKAVAVEIEARLPDGTVRNTANFFHLNDQGRIERLTVYWRS